MRSILKLLALGLTIAVFASACVSGDSSSSEAGSEDTNPSGPSDDSGSDDSSSDGSSGGVLDSVIANDIVRCGT